VSPSLTGFRFRFGWALLKRWCLIETYIRKLYYREYTSRICAISSVDGKTDLGVRVALGDSSASPPLESDGPETTEILIYGHLSVPPTTSQAHDTPTQLQIQLHVACISPSYSSNTTTTTIRLPRPDDPTPRQVPIAFTSTTHTKRKFSRWRWGIQSPLHTYPF
jgi:hypothetical protein